MRICVTDSEQLGKLLSSALEKGDSGLLLGVPGFQYDARIVKKAIDRGYLTRGQIYTRANISYSLVNITDRGAARLTDLIEMGKAKLPETETLETIRGKYLLRQIEEKFN